MPLTSSSYSEGIKRFVSLLLVGLTGFYSAFSQNAIVTENALPGNPETEWDLVANSNNVFGDLSIQGFATDISVNAGSSISFKVDVNTGTDKIFGIKIYRLGYYQGNGARLIANLGNFTGVAQNACLVNSTTGLTDCGNWTVSASWTVPSNAVSGIYLAKLTRSAAGGGGSSHIAFVVRNDASTSALCFKASDATWQAYNNYGGNSLYVGAGLANNHGSKVSYNRPFLTRNGGGGGGTMEDWVFNAEYPMIRFLERNGFDMSYTTDVDLVRSGNLLLNHKVFMSVGHDEYWSAEERNSVEAARAAGKHLAFFSGNEVYWKTRWENSTDGSNTPYRTMVCYKEGTLATPAENPCGGKCDPTQTWTGLWRDGCGYAGVTDACKPENALSGEISWDGTGGTITVPFAYKSLRFWRNTPAVSHLTSGQTATLAPGTLGYEWDWEQYASSNPPGRITMSNTLLDARTHKLSLYKTSAGGWVFGAGTVQWAWGLDDNHDKNVPPWNQTSTDMQQATINLFADMGVQPATLQSGLIAATASTDVTPPVTTITSPVNGASTTSSAPITITGTATDANVIAGVEISTDGGITWTAASGTTSWTYSWTPTANGTYTIKARGIDDSGNYTATASSPSISFTVNVASSLNCPCTVFGSTVPSVTVGRDNTTGIVLGMKFSSSVGGFITGIRFYKVSGNTGTHQGLLYNTSGTLLAQATFTAETASGWQQVNFSTPVSITSGQTYVAAYFSNAGYYSSTNNYFTTAVVNNPLTALADGTNGSNGLYIYSTTAAYPANSYQQGNYWVDAIFNNNVTLSANAGANQTITLPTSTVTLNGSGSTGTITSYAWTLVSGPNTPVITTPTTVSSTVTGLIQGTYVYRLSLNGGLSTSQVSITVNPAPLPVANAGTNQTITLPTSTVTLNGSGSTGTITSYAWTLVSGPNTPTITTPAAATSTVTGLIQGTYIFQLSVNGGVSTSQVTITVSPAPPPVANAGTNQTITLPASSVTLNGSGSTGTITSYAWTLVSGPNTPAITTPAVVTTTVTGLIQGTYVFQLSLNGGLSTSQVTIAVSPAPPPVANAGTNQTITLPASSVTLNGTGSTGTITSYAWTLVSGPNTPVITTPTTISSTVTGLIQGTYVFQLSVNGGVSNSQVTVSVIPISTATIFTTQTPAVSTGNDGQALELGVKFRSTLAGFITAVRFYKTTGNSGTHTGELYSTTGTRLAQAVFTNETSTGWQTVVFSSPVAVAANTTYVAAYFSSAGYYISTNNYFTAAVVNSPLSALADGTDGSNGVYSYTASPAFPVNSYKKGNYWVDVVFASSITPVANAGTNQTITLPTSSVTLNGSGSSGSISSYAWTLVSGPNTPTITTPTLVGTTVTGLIQGTYIFQLAVNSGASTSRVSITVNPAPPPVANAGTNQTITLPTSTVTLNGSGSTGTITSYAWTLVSGPNTPTITTPAAATTTVTGLIQGAYVFQLSLNGGVSTSQVTITVSPAPPPVANAGTNQTITLPASSVTLNGSGSTGTITSYAWTLVSGPNTPTITTPTVVTTTVTGLIQGTYVFQLSVNNGVSVSQVTVTVNSIPPVANAGTSQIIALPGSSTTLDGSGSNGSISSYSWTVVSGPNVPTITTPTAVSTTVTGLIQGTYVFQLSLNGGVSSAQVIVLVSPISTATIFTTQTPTTPVENDHSAIELGTKFRSSVSGQIIGVRFYKSTGNTGTHTGELYTNTGTRLAQAVFTGETSSGWQQVLFSSPVTIAAGTTYIAAYFSSAGNYTSTGGFFDTAVANNPLTALANGTDGVNGVYSYTTSPAFPTSTYQEENYWVDAIFKGVIPSADITPPTIFSTTPTVGNTKVPTNKNIYTFFSETLNASTVNANTVFLKSGSAAVAASVSYNQIENSAVLTPSVPLNAGTTYTMTIKGGTGTNKIKDLAGNAMVSDSVWSFTTATNTALPNPANGPGGPILLISSSTNPFSRYPVEILRAEGWNAFMALDISAVTTTELNKYDVVIVGDISLTSAQVTLLTNWVNAGGTLIAFHPDPQLAGLMGITAVGTTLQDKYLLVSTASGPGVGIVNQTIQYHGAADLYTANSGTKTIATLYSDASTSTIYPAITSKAVGTSGGTAVAFTYDLAKSVVYTRQGNPAWAGQKRDGAEPPIRSDDMFFGNASFDHEPDWVNLNKVAIPQADEQQRLLTNIILAGNYNRKPLPRFWFLPKGKKAAIVMTGDDHANGGTVGRMNQYISLSSSNTASAVANWDAIRSTSYMYANTPITNAQLALFQNQGFELGLHVNPNCGVWTPAQLQNYFDTQNAEFLSQYYVADTQVTHRIHCLSWSDWATLPKMESQRGIRFDVNYYYWPDTWISGHPGMFTGSGIPMRFADTDGSLIDCYQAPSQLTDESGQLYPDEVDALLSKATGPQGYYGVFTANMHTDLVLSQGSDAIINSAMALQIPVVSAKQMLEWTDARNNSTFSNYTWSNSQLGFSVSQDAKALNLKGMLPRVIGAGSFISLTRNGVTISTTTDSIKGISYVFFDATNGNYVATYAITAPGNSVAQLAHLVPTLDSISAQLTYYLGQNYPNPFSQNTRINYSIPNSAMVELILYDMQGRPVKIMVNEMKEAGNYSYELNVTNLSRGIYLYKMHSGNFIAVKKLIIE